MWQCGLVVKEAMLIQWLGSHMLHDLNLYPYIRKIELCGALVSWAGHLYLKTTTARETGEPAMRLTPHDKDGNKHGYFG